MNHILYVLYVYYTLYACAHTIHGSPLTMSMPLFDLYIWIIQQDVISLEILHRILTTTGNLPNDMYHMIHYDNRCDMATQYFASIMGG